MNDLISRQAAIDMFQNLAHDDWNQCVSTTWANAFAESADMINDLPSAQLERKKGKWIKENSRPKGEVFICSECNGWAYSPWIGSRRDNKPNRCNYNYCPNCGADMRGER